MTYLIRTLILAISPSVCKKYRPPLSEGVSTFKLLRFRKINQFFRDIGMSFIKDNDLSSNCP